MEQIKDELQSIIIGNGQDGSNSKLQKVQNFLRGNAQPGSESKEQKYLKSEEESLLIDLAKGKIFSTQDKFLKNCSSAKERNNAFTVSMTTV